MSAWWLPRGSGLILKCNDCDEQLQTANIIARSNRAYAAKLGWGRGLRRGRKRADLCPKCFSEEKALVAKQKAERAERQAARDEKRKAAAA